MTPRHTPVGLGFLVGFPQNKVLVPSEPGSGSLHTWFWFPSDMVWSGFCSPTHDDGHTLDLVMPYVVICLLTLTFKTLSLGLQVLTCSSSVLFFPYFVSLSCFRVNVSTLTNYDCFPLEFKLFHC